MPVNAATPRMRRRYRIDVTQEDIAKAIPEDSSVCAVARALARTIPDAKNVRVDVQSIRFTRARQRLVYLTPISVAQYVVDFDGGRPLEPFSFSIDESRMIPVKTQKLTPIGQLRQKTIDRAGRHARKVAKAAGKDSRAAFNNARRMALRTFNKSMTPSEHGPMRQATSGIRGSRQFPVVNRKVRHYGHRDLMINQRWEADMKAAEERARASASPPPTGD